MAFDYDKQIKDLTADPDLIDSDWGYAVGLFRFASPCGETNTPDGQAIGCLTQIREGIDDDTGLEYVAWTPELTEEIRADKRIPLCETDITVKDLPVFKEWQERLDKEIRNAV